MYTLSRRQPRTVLALTVLSLSAALGSAQAAVVAPEAPALSRAALRPAVGQYQLADGRVVSLHLWAQRLIVGIDDAPAEAWKPAGPDLFVSPDGLLRLRLHREANGSIERVALEADRPR